MPMPDYPYTNFHELNLDWIIKKLKEAYSPDNPPDNLVLSVNGQTGDVVLYQDAEVVFPAVDSQAWEIKRYVAGNHTVGIAFQKNSPAMRLNGSTWYDIYDEGNPPPYPVTSVNGQTGAVTAVSSVNGQTGDVTGVYDSSNPPPYPVTSVNGQTGTVTITIPVQSVNGQTGAVTVPVAFKNNSANYLEPTTASSVNEWGLQRDIPSGNCGISFEIENGHVVGYLNFTDSNDTVVDTLKILTPADIPASSGVVSVNGMTGVVTGLYDANNPPPYPVTSVNGATGAVVLTGDTVPTAVGNNTPLSTTIENAYEESLEDIAIVVKGDKTTNPSGASIGQYVVVRNSTITGVTDGLYTAVQSIPYNTSIDSTYLSTALPNGIANTLSGRIENVCERYAINGGQSETFLANAGSVILITRASISEKSIYVIDQLGNIVEFMSGTKNETITISTTNEWLVTVTNNSGAAFQVTVIRPYN